MIKIIFTKYKLMLFLLYYKNTLYGKRAKIRQLNFGIIFTFTKMLENIYPETHVKIMYFYVKLEHNYIIVSK